MFEKIRFNDTDFVNYFGIKKLDLLQDWETVYEKLVHDNSISDIALGHIFLDRTLHVRYNWSFLRKHNLPRMSFWWNLLDRLVNGPNRINENLRFTGLFKVINYDRIPKLEQSGYCLTPSKYSYISAVVEHDQHITPTERIQLPRYYEFQLQENQIREDKRGRAAIPYVTDSSSTSDDDYIKENLYFHLFDVIDACVSHFECDFEYKNSPSDVEYKEGIKLAMAMEKSEKKSVTIKSEDTKPDYRNRPSPEALENMLSVVVEIMKSEHPEDYPTDDVIIKLVETRHPKVKGAGLSYSSMSKALASGRKRMVEKTTIKGQLH